jgi:outer membrane lipoprotein-sorting protein
MRLTQTLPNLAILALLAFAPLPGQAQAQATKPPAASQASDLAGIENYLNGLTTAQADFTFAGPDGSVSHGVFYLSRPSKLRFEYTQPKGNLLIADGDYVIYWDAQQKEASNLPISSTPLDFLLRPKVSLTDGVKVTAFEHSAGVIRATLVSSKNEGDGSVTVAFGDNPTELRGWRLVDGQGGTTDVTFSNWKFGMSLDASLFHFVDPNSRVRHR